MVVLIVTIELTALLVDSTRLARDLWPEGLGRMVRDTTDIISLPPSRVVPLDEEAMLRWLCVDSGSDGQTATVLAHPETVNGDNSVLLTLRIQGVVDRFALQPTGNWKG